MSLRILHVLDHSIPLHSGYTFRTQSILREQRKLGWQTYHLTTPKQTGATQEEEDVDGWHFFRTVALKAGGGPTAVFISHQVEELVRGGAQHFEISFHAPQEVEPWKVALYKSWQNVFSGILALFRLFLFIKFYFSIFILIFTQYDFQIYNDKLHNT